MTTMTDGADEPTRCPVCGEGVLAEVSFDVAPEGEISQRPESHQLTTYSCGHRVVGSELSSADPEQLDVERRSSEETTDPISDD
jgi:hypothetical protein